MFLRQDLVPILPGRFLGFHHAIGEKHIQANNSWVACPGIDNTDPQCTTGAVKNLFYGNADDHMGMLMAMCSVPYKLNVIL